MKKVKKPNPHLEEKYKQGYNEGYTIGFEAGFASGHAEAVDMAAAFVDVRQERIKNIPRLGKTLQDRITAEMEIPISEDERKRALVIAAEYKKIRLKGMK